MKTHLLLLSLLALAPVVASARSHAKTPPAAPFLEIDPAARQLLNQAREKYASLRSLSFEVSSQAGGEKTGRSTVRFQAPNSLVLTQERNGKTQTITCFGNRIFVDRGATFSDLSIPNAAGLPTLQVPRQTVLDLVSGVGAEGTGVGNTIADWLQNEAILDDPRLAESGKKHGFRVRVSTLAPKAINGALLRGIKTQILPTNANSSASASERILWFDLQAPLLRRVEGSFSLKNEKPTVLVDTLFNQRLNPTFSPAAFDFAPGNRIPEQDTSPFHYDPRLVVGAHPYEFSAKSLSGQTIAPSDYRGKVLLLDFWATWCEPCVESLPELQGVYRKYHGQGLEVVGVSLDEDQGQLQGFVKAHKIPWPQVFDGKAWQSGVPNIYGVKAIPFFLIVGRDGEIAAVNPRDDLEGAAKRALTAK